MYSVMAALSPFLASFYQAPPLQALMPVFALGILVAPISGQPKAILSRNKRFDKIATIRVVSISSAALVAILFARNGYGTWALVWRFVFQTTVSSVLFLVLAQTRFQLVGIGTVRQYWDNVVFGIRIVFARLVSSLAQSLDRFILGKFSTVDFVGQYTRSHELARIPDTQIRNSLTTPALAYLARIKGGAQARHYITLEWGLLCVIGFPCFVLITTGNWLMPWFMGSQWVEAGLLLQWLGLWGLGKFFHGTGELFHMNQQLMARWFWLSIAGIPATLAVPTLLLVVGGDLFAFVRWYSVCYCLYWFVVFFQAMLRAFGWHVSILLSGVKQFCFIALVSGIALGFKEWYKGIPLAIDASRLLNIAIVTGSVAGLTVLFAFLLAKREISEARRYMTK